MRDIFCCGDGSARAGRFDVHSWVRIEFVAILADLDWVDGMDQTCSEVGIGFAALGEECVWTSAVVSLCLP